MRNIPKFRFAISDLLLFTLCVAIAIQGFRNFPGAGSGIWVCMFAATIFFSVRQIVQLVNCINLPFVPTNVAIRNRWIAKRAIGAILLSFHIVCPKELRPENFAFDSVSTDFSQTLSSSIFGVVGQSTGLIGFLLCVLPLYSFRTFKNSSRMILVCTRLLCIAFAASSFLLIVLDSQMTPALIHMATTGIELGMHKSVEVHMGRDFDQIENLGWNRKLYVEKTYWCTLFAIIVLLSLLSWFYVREFKLKVFFAVGWAVSLLGLTLQLSGLYLNELPKLHFVMQESLVWPSVNAMITLAGFCLLIGFGLACLSFRSHSISVPLNKQKLSSFQPPPLLLTSMLAGALIEIYLLANYSWIWFGTTTNRWLDYDWPPSSFSLVSLTVGYYFAFPLLIWILICGLILIQRIADQFWYFDRSDTRYTASEIRLTSLAIPTLACAVSLVPLAIAFGNLGFASIMDGNSPLMNAYCFVIPENFGSDWLEIPAIAVAAFTVAYLIWSWNKTRRNNTGQLL